MRISHRELEICRRNPKQWYREAKQPGRRGPPPGYNSLLKNGILKFHKLGDVLAARTHLAQLYTNAAHRLTNPRKVEKSFEKFDHYVQSVGSSSTIVADSRVRIRLSNVGFLELTGEVHRVDMAADGQRAILLGDYPPDWRAQLRFPLIQRVIARHYGVPEREVFVGVQNLDGSGLQVTQYSKTQIDAALREFATLGKSISS